MRLLASGALIPLMGCSVLQPATQDLARETAAAAVAPIAAERAPGVSTDRAVTCILDNADRSQITALAAETAQGQGELADDIVMDVLYREGTQRCMRTRFDLFKLVGY